MARAVRQFASTGRMSQLAIPVLADAADHIDKLTAQRDELLDRVDMRTAERDELMAALDSLWLWVSEERIFTTSDPVPDSLGERVMDAIAKCEGREVS
jgi:hypothetical protein